MNNSKPSLPKKDIRPEKRVAENGQSAMTRGVEALFPDVLIAQLMVSEFIRRHRNRDWGTLCQEDQAYQEALLQEPGARPFLMSVFQWDNKPIWVETASGWGTTVALLPEEH